MDTDKQLYKLFTAAPSQLYELLGLPAPSDVCARAETFKDVQTEADLVLEPAEEVEPARLVDFQAYRDKKFVPKVMLRCAQRQAWLEVFHCWLMTRLPLKLEEIRKMIARLPDVEETPRGKELKERWTLEARAEARAEDLRQIIQRRKEDLKHQEQLFRDGVLSEAAYRDLKARAEQEVQQYRADLESLACGSG